METRALPFPTAVSTAVSGSFVDETGHLDRCFKQMGQRADLQYFHPRRHIRAHEGQSSRPQRDGVEYKDYETAVASYRRPEYQATPKIWVSIAETDFIVVEGIAA